MFNEPQRQVLIQILQGYYGMQQRLLLAPMVSAHGPGVHPSLPNRHDWSTLSTIYDVGQRLGSCMQTVPLCRCCSAATAGLKMW